MIHADPSQYRVGIFHLSGCSEINALVQRIIQETPEYDFVQTTDRHHLAYKRARRHRPAYGTACSNTRLYVADGHHRTAAAALVGAERKAQNPNHTGDEEYNYFMTVYSSSHLKSLTITVCQRFKRNDPGVFCTSPFNDFSKL